MVRTGFAAPIDRCLSLVAAMLLFLAASAGAAPSGWWDLNWRHSKWITFTAGSAAIPSGYSVSLTFDHAGLVAASKSRADGNDVRVAYWNGALWTALDRVLDPGSSWNSPTTTIWFRLQAGIGASSFDDNYGLYYGNSAAGAPPANGTNVFLAYDGFESGDLSGWPNVVQAAGDTIAATTTTVRSGTYSGEVTINAADPGQASVRAEYAAQVGVASVIYAYFPAGYNFNADTSLNQLYGGIWGQQQLTVNVRSPGREFFIWNNFVGEPYWGVTTASTGQWYRLELRSIVSPTVGRAELWVNGVREANEFNRNTGTIAIDNNLVGIYWKNSGPNTLFVDDTFTRMWVDGDPTSSFGTENVCCSSLQVAVGGGAITVTAPSWFEMRFANWTGGGLDLFYDLAEDPSRTRDLAGDNLGQPTLYADEIVQAGLTWYITGNSGSSGSYHLLEATPTRTRIRQHSYYQNGPAGAILPGAQATGDYSVYPSGRMAIRWNRRTTTAVSYDDLQRNVTAYYQAAGPMSSWAGYGQSGPLPPDGAGNEDFVLVQNDVPEARTDFLAIPHQDWVAATRLFTAGYLPEAGFEATYQDLIPGTLPAGSVESWDLLMYFKPTSFANHLDPAVISRSGDYRTPDPLSAIGPGSGWNENTADADFFNESEAAYTLDLDPGSGLAFDIDGAPTPRYSPFFKIRQWRSLARPTSVTLEGAALTQGIHYLADVKPVARGYTAENLRWHCTLESGTACNPGNLDVGSTGGTNGVGIVTGKHGNGALIDANGDYVAAGTAASGDFSDLGGWIEFWYQPNYDYNDGAEHALWSTQSGPDCFYFRKTTANELQFTIHKNGGDCTTGGSTFQITLAGGIGFTWRAGDWVHLATAWGDGGPLRIFVDGVERVQGDLFVASGISHDVLYFGGCGGGACPSGTTTHANGVLDEIHIYDYRLAQIGNASFGDYLGDPSGGLNYGFTGLTGVDAARRGNYLYFGVDSKFRGLNAAFAVPVGGPSDGGMVWEYWNGGNWTSLELPGFVDETKAFKEDGTIYWTADPPGWSLYSIGGSPDLYYVRAHLATGESYSVPPTEVVIKTDILLFQYCADITTIDQTFVFAAPVPTAVDFAGFSARGLDGAVVLSWETASELDNLGFHLYRAESPEGPYERITSAASPGLGSSPAGARYRYVDSAVTNGKTYFYRLEDIETTGKTELHGPVSATPAPEAGGPPPPLTSGEIVYGSPQSSSLRIVERNRKGLVLELTTEGFEAELSEDGSLRLSIPDFEVASAPGTPAIPVRRTWVEVEDGRGVRLTSVHEESVETFSSLRPSATESFEVVASRRGTVRAGRRAKGEGASFRGPGLYPEEAARLLTVGYQGTTKKALLELSPLRWDRMTGQLVLARKLRVRLTFAGREQAGHGEASHRRRAEKRGVVRLVSRARGLYEVGFEETLGGRGVPVAALRLSRQGVPVAFHLEPNDEVFGPGSHLYFWSEGASQNPYGSEAVYELEREPGGVSMSRRPFEPESSTLGFCWQRVEREENRFYQAALLEAKDLWLWDLLFAPVEKSYSFDVRALAPTMEASRLSVWLQGTSDFEASPDHHVRVRLNGVPVAEAYFEGKNDLGLDADVPTELLHEGENLVSIENVGDTAAAYSMVMLDRFVVEYPSQLVASGGTLEGVFRESGEAAIAGVSERAHALDVTEEPVRWLDSAPAASFGLRLAVEPGRRYAVVDPGAVFRPEVRKAARSALQRESNRADYLMVGPRALLEAAAPLLALRRTQGLVSRAAPLEEIYSEFGHGESRPAAIRDFLSYTFHRWRKPSPRYVLLLGDATYDFKDYLGTGVANQLPPLTVKTSYLWTASDPAYAALNGDDILPDVAIGRLPGASAAEIRVMVDKILAYETNAASSVGATVLVADNPDEAGDFEQDADELASGVLASRDPRRIYLRPLGVEPARQAIMEALDSGASLLSYVGHGGIQLWAHENLFDISRVGSLLPQSTKPVVLTLNCLNGYFHFPYFNALSEELLKAEGKGAIAAFSPSGLSLNEPAHVFHQALLRELVSGERERLGDAVLAAQESYAASGAFPELLRIYHLLGDPALTLK